ncbi:MAG TPA: DUF4199 domain-containing protein [Steroidobacteraceae bacterium]|nr:DUF4199 domain-containing protein [Steroidobacteraceae bacterium]
MEAQSSRSIKAIALKYGLIQGAISFILFLLGTIAGIRFGSAVTAVNSVILIVLIILAHSEYKRAHAGMMSYPQGLGSGTLLAAIAAVVDAILVFIYLKYINSGYLVTIAQAQRAAIERRGISGAQAQQALTIVSAFRTPLVIVLTSLVTTVIIGFIISLIVSIFTQKEDSRAVV